MNASFTHRCVHAICLGSGQMWSIELIMVRKEMRLFFRDFGQYPAFTTLRRDPDNVPHGVLSPRTTRVRLIEDMDPNPPALSHRCYLAISRSSPSHLTSHTFHSRLIPRKIPLPSSHKIRRDSAGKRTETRLSIVPTTVIDLAL